MADEKIFEVTGKFGKSGNERKFAKRVKAVSGNFAAEKVLALFGSKHRLKRRNIFINEIKEVGEDAGKEGN